MTAKTDPQEPSTPSFATVRLRPLYPVSRFEHGIKGAPPLERAGTEVPASLADAIRAAADKSAVNLEECQ